MSKEAMKQALEAFKKILIAHSEYTFTIKPVIKALQEALAKQEPKPFGYTLEETMKCWDLGYAAAVKALALKQEQRNNSEHLGEPVAWLVYAKGSRKYFTLTFDLNKVPEIYVGGEAVPLYTTPQQRTWVGLTEEDIDNSEIHLTSCRNNHESWIEGIREFANALEAKLKEKNNA